MLIPRFLVSMFSFGLMVLGTGVAFSQDYPNKPIRIVTAEVGGGGDFASRLIAQGMTDSMSQQVIVENRGGAAGIIAAQTVAKAPPGYEAVSLLGMFAPAKTPAALINRMNQEIVRALNRTDVKERFLSGGAETVGSSPEQFAATMKSEMARMGKVIKDAGIKAH